MIPSEADFRFWRGLFVGLLIVMPVWCCIGWALCFAVNLWGVR